MAIFGYLCFYILVAETYDVTINGAYVTGSAKTCQDARIFENQFLAFYNSLVHGDYNAVCFTAVACSVAKLRAPPFPCSAEERLE